MATIAGEHNRLLYVTVVVTKVCYLVDIGAEVSVLHENSNDRLHETFFSLQAENTKAIAAHPKQYVYLNVSLRKPNHCFYTNHRHRLAAIQQ